MIAEINLGMVFGVESVERPLLVAGPCSAESREQVLAVGLALRDQGVHIFRAGLWKPRTRPDSFEGVGVAGLPWLAELKRETGLLIATEVASPTHVDAVLRAGIDVVWIGARTSVNTFAVQELAEALRGTNLPVLVKNPVSPDLDLWVGAVERLLRVGVTRVAGIHRGFSRFGVTRYRNPPEWQIPLDFRLRMPGIPILCDPSHIAGAREFVREVAQRALDLSFDGLMIEVHADPANALSDARQQVTPEALSQLMRSLVRRHEEEVDESFRRRLADFRAEIDELDGELLAVLERRMLVTESIGRLKRQHGVTILQSSRWDYLLQRMLREGVCKGLSCEFITRLFKAIHDESIEHQNSVMNVAGP